MYTKIKKNKNTTVAQCSTGDYTRIFISFICFGLSMCVRCTYDVFASLHIFCRYSFCCYQHISHKALTIHIFASFCSVIDHIIALKISVKIPLLLTACALVCIYVVVLMRSGEGFKQNDLCIHLLIIFVLKPLRIRIENKCCDFM